MVDKDLRLSGKTAIVTGAGSSGPGVGTGKAASILLSPPCARSGPFCKRHTPNKKWKSVGIGGARHRAQQKCRKY